MQLKAVLGIKDAGGHKVKKYRILDESNGQIRDIPIDKIKEVIQNKGITIEGLKLQNGGLIETSKIIHITELRESSISLYNWCQQNGERGQRILTEFNNGGNEPINSKDISNNSGLKMKFRCTTCEKISEQYVNSKTGKTDRKCKYCAGKSREISLLEWCNTHGVYGQIILKEYIDGGNTLPPDKINYGSTAYANFSCIKCGYTNKEKIHHRITHFKRNSCCKCNNRGTSFGEQLILYWLQAQGIDAINQYSLQTEFGTKKLDIYIPKLNLAIEHQSGMHRDLNQQMNDDKTSLMCQHLGIYLLEICELDSNYQRTENNWCITYERYNKHMMINKLQAWFFTNYNITLSNQITPEIGIPAWKAKCNIQYKDSLACVYPAVASRWISELNYGLTPDIIPHNSCYRFWLLDSKTNEPKLFYLNNETAKERRRKGR